MKCFKIPEERKRQFHIGFCIIIISTILFIAFLSFAIPFLIKNTIQLKNNANEAIAYEKNISAYANNIKQLNNDVALSNFKASEISAALPPELTEEQILLDINQAEANVKNFNAASVKTTFDGDQNDSEVLRLPFTIIWNDTYDKSKQFIQEFLKSPRTYNVLEYSVGSDNANKLQVMAYGQTSIQDNPPITETTNSNETNIKDFVLDINPANSNFLQAVFERYKGYNSPLSTSTDIVLNLTQIGNKYYYNYVIGNQSYPPDSSSEITSYDGQNFVIEVNDNTSGTSPKINLKINNQTDKKVDFIGDTKRLNILNINN